VVVWLTLLYSLSWHLFVGNSDDANSLLAGHSLLHGNLLLRHWRMPTDNFWSIELPWYALFAGVIGLSTSVLHAVPTLIAGALVAIATASVLGPAGPRRRGIGAAVTFAILGLPVPLLGTFLLQTPMHIGTVLLCLASFLLLGKGFGQRWWLAVGLLAAAVLGDPLAVALGSGPIAAAGVVSGLRNRSYRSAVPGLTAAVASIGAALAGRLLLRGLGGFTTAPALPLSPQSYWTTTVRAVPGRLAWLLGASPQAPMPHVWSVLRGVHAVGAALIVVGVSASSVAVIVSMWPGRTRTNSRGSTNWLDDVLTVGFWSGLVVFIVFAQPHADINAARYLVPSVVYGAILAGRFTAKHITQHGARRHVSGAAWAAAALLVCSYFSTSWATVRGAGVANSTQTLAHWLEVNHLEDGIAPYWDASIVTVVSHGAVRVRPVMVADGRLHGVAYFSSSEWFRNRGTQERSFLVYEPDAPWGGVNDVSAIGTFGPPRATIDLLQYRVLIWDSDIRPLVGQPVDLPR
jgi:hypothetical protein